MKKFPLLYLFSLIATLCFPAFSFDTENYQMEFEFDFNLGCLPELSSTIGDQCEIKEYNLTVKKQLESPQFFKYYIQPSENIQLEKQQEVIAKAANNNKINENYLPKFKTNLPSNFSDDDIFHDLSINQFGSHDNLDSFELSLISSNSSDSINNQNPNQIEIEELLIESETQKIDSEKENDLQVQRTKKRLAEDSPHNPNNKRQKTKAVQEANKPKAKTLAVELPDNHESKKADARVTPTKSGSNNNEAKKRSRLPAKAVTLFRAWLFSHLKFPYPTEDEKEELALKSGLKVTQVNNWFTNARRRLLPREGWIR